MSLCQLGTSRFTPKMILEKMKFLLELSFYKLIIIKLLKILTVGLFLKSVFAIFMRLNLFIHNEL